MFTDLSLDAVDGSAIEDLKKLGYTLIADNKGNFTKIIAELCDEHYLLPKGLKYQKQNS